MNRDTRTMGFQILVWTKGSSDPSFEYINLEEPEINSAKAEKLMNKIQK